jgi:signal peptidase I
MNETTREPPPEAARHRWLAARLKPWLPMLAFALVVLCARASLADHYVVPSGSMEPTVEIGDRILVHKAAFGLRVPGTQTWLGHVEAPEPGTVVVIAPPEDEGPVLLKRVVATAGDRVVVRHGRLEINGRGISLEPVTPFGSEAIEHLGPPHRVRLDRGGGPDFGPVTVPSGQMLVMGDNRGNSRDGRSFGFVDVGSVRGRALAVYFRSGALTWEPL